MQEYITIGAIVYVVAGVGTAIHIPLKSGWGWFFLTIVLWPISIINCLRRNFGNVDMDGFD